MWTDEGKLAILVIRQFFNLFSEVVKVIRRYIIDVSNEVLGTELVHVRWTTSADAGQIDPTVQLSGAKGNRRERGLNLSSGKLEYSVALPARYRDGGHIQIYLDLMSDDRHPQTLFGEHVTQV